MWVEWAVGRYGGKFGHGSAPGMFDAMWKAPISKYGLSVFLVFVGIKMLISDIYKIPTLIALIVVFCLFTISILAYEKRIDKIINGKLSLSHHFSKLFGHPQTAKS